MCLVCLVSGVAFDSGRGSFFVTDKECNGNVVEASVGGGGCPFLDFRCGLAVAGEVDAGGGVVVCRDVFFSSVVVGKAELCHSAYVN